MRTKACDSWRGEEAICRDQISLSRMAWPWALLFLPRFAVLVGALLIAPVSLASVTVAHQRKRAGGGICPGGAWLQDGDPLVEGVRSTHGREVPVRVFSTRGRLPRWTLEQFRSRGSPRGGTTQVQALCRALRTAGGSSAARASPVVDETINWVAGMTLGCVPSWRSSCPPTGTDWDPQALTAHGVSDLLPDPSPLAAAKAVRDLSQGPRRTRL